MLRILLSASVIAVSLAGTSVAEVSDERGIEEVVVTAGSSIQERLGAAGSGTVLTAKEIQQIGATHASEALNRVAGVWGQPWIRARALDGCSVCGNDGFRRLWRV